MVGLFVAIGIAYGNGDGSTTFNIPDFVGKFPRGGTPGTVGGSDVNNHTHSLSTAFDVDPGSGNLTVTSSTTGGPSDSENRPAFLEIGFIIKV